MLDHWDLRVLTSSTVVPSSSVLAWVTSGPGHEENIAGFQHESERERVRRVPVAMLWQWHICRGKPAHGPHSLPRLQCLPWTSGNLNSAAL